MLPFSSKGNLWGFVVPSFKHSIVCDTSHLLCGLGGHTINVITKICARAEKGIQEMDNSAFAFSIYVLADDPDWAIFDIGLFAGASITSTTFKDYRLQAIVFPKGGFASFVEGPTGDFLLKTDKGELAAHQVLYGDAPDTVVITVDKIWDAI